jgi:hypothetical protein
MADIDHLQPQGVTRQGGNDPATVSPPPIVPRVDEKLRVASGSDTDPRHVGARGFSRSSTVKGSSCVVPCRCVSTR